VAALAQTPAGVGKPGTTSYGIADLTLNAGSPLLAQLLSGVGDALSPLLASVGNLLNLSQDCPLVNGTLPDLSLDGGAVVISSSTGGLTIDLEKLLEQANLNLNALPPNTDLIDVLLDYLTSPDGLADGLINVINGLFSDLKSQLDACAPNNTISNAIDLLFNVTGALHTALDKILGPLGDTTSPLAPIGTLLKKLVDIGINVQPNGPAGTFTSQLRATPSQTTPVVPGQTIVRAIEINLVGDPLATVALANAAAGPSAAAVVPPATSLPGTAIPTGVPAGFQKPSGTPELPLVLLTVGIVLAAGGAVAWKLRATPAH
jgi:hypothetical protein